MNMLNLSSLFKRHGIIPQGVVHIGAHEGKEISVYLQMGFKVIVLIEANPEVFRRLENNLQGFENVISINCAASNRDGTAILKVTSNDQSSSILPLASHAELYPDIVQLNEVEVPCRRLDSLLIENGINPADINFLNIDIQGAELMALQGATCTLCHLEAINAEINYTELYEGCSLVEEIDAYLAKWELIRVATITPCHPSWGDGFYVRKPSISMRNLGMYGRFGNQIFQYAFLRIYAAVNKLLPQVPEWVGQKLFVCQDNAMMDSEQLGFAEKKYAQIPSFPFGTNFPLSGSDILGFFQHHTAYYRRYQKYFRKMFQPTESLKKELHLAVERLSKRGTLVGLHLRRGDYGYGYFFVPPNEWYLDWLGQIWSELNNPILYIATDDPDSVLPDFMKYAPFTSADLGIICETEPAYLDFYVLSSCDKVAISNSSFSFSACMLNERASELVRPHLPSGKLINFDPWNAEPLLKDAEVSKEDPGWIPSNLPYLGELQIFPFHIGETVYIGFPDWDQSGDALVTELHKVLNCAAVSQPGTIFILPVKLQRLDWANEVIAAAFYTYTFAEEATENLCISEGVQVIASPIDQNQWLLLRPLVYGRVFLWREDAQAVEVFGANDLPITTPSTIQASILQLQNALEQLP